MTRRWIVCKFAPIFALLIVTTACPPKVGTREEPSEGDAAVKRSAKDRTTRAKVVASIGEDRITVGMLEDELNNL